nr:SDR family NAD(P)-dependent oxidoreductase [uncultured Rhodopila sp.]
MLWLISAGAFLDAFDIDLAGGVIALRDGWAVTGISRRVPGMESPRFSHIALDLSRAGRDDLRAALDGMPVTVFVHAAGLLRPGSLGEAAAGDGAAMWRLHVEAASMLADVVVPGMPTGGRIVLIGSRTASGAGGRSQYAATKAALVGLARSPAPLRRRACRPSAASCSPKKWQR